MTTEGTRREPPARDDSDSGSLLEGKQRRHSPTTVFSADGYTTCRAPRKPPRRIFFLMATHEPPEPPEPPRRRAAAPPGPPRIPTVPPRGGTVALQTHHNAPRRSLVMPRAPPARDGRSPPCPPRPGKARPAPRPPASASSRPPRCTAAGARGQPCALTQRENRLCPAGHPDEFLEEQNVLHVLGTAAGAFAVQEVRGRKAPHGFLILRVDNNRTALGILE